LTLTLEHATASTLASERAASIDLDHASLEVHCHHPLPQALDIIVPPLLTSTPPPLKRTAIVLFLKP
jgi:ABC-type amino acid transport system permease subunit